MAIGGVGRLPVVLVEQMGVPSFAFVKIGYRSQHALAVLPYICSDALERLLTVQPLRVTTPLPLPVRRR